MGLEARKAYDERMKEEQKETPKESPEFFPPPESIEPIPY